MTLTFMKPFSFSKILIWMSIIYLLALILGCHSQVPIKTSSSSVKKSTSSVIELITLDFGPTKNMIDEFQLGEDIVLSEDQTGKKVEELLLRFYIVNNSERSFVDLVNVNVHYLGLLFLKDDLIGYPERTLDIVAATFQKRIQTTDLGQLLFSARTPEIGNWVTIKPAFRDTLYNTEKIMLRQDTSEQMLFPENLKYRGDFAVNSHEKFYRLPPKSSLFYEINIICTKALEQKEEVTKILIAEPYIQRNELMVMGTKIEGSHIFDISVDYLVNGQKKGRINSDRIYSVEPFSETLTYPYSGLLILLPDSVITIGGGIIRKEFPLKISKTAQIDRLKIKDWRVERAEEFLLRTIHDYILLEEETEVYEYYSGKRTKPKVKYLRSIFERENPRVISEGIPLSSFYDEISQKSPKDIAERVYFDRTRRTNLLEILEEFKPGVMSILQKLESLDTDLRRKILYVRSLLE